MVGAVVGIALIVSPRHGRNTPIPFGPYLAAAGLIALSWGEASIGPICSCSEPWCSLSGLTVESGSGKTTVAELFASHGAGLVDTDKRIFHHLTAPAQPAITEIVRKFGPQFVAADGSLDRVRMRDLVFADPLARKDLEAILHPLIRQESSRQIRQSTAPYVIVVVPLLFETGNYRSENGRILVVDCQQEIQISRVMTRSGLSRSQVLSIIASQVSGRIGSAGPMTSSTMMVTSVRCKNR